MLDIHIAHTNEINELLSIYVDKVKWLNSVNKPLWDESQFQIDKLIEKYTAPVFFVGCINNVIIGGFILIEFDRQYWPEITSNDSFYFHKFIIRNEYCGKGYSDEMISWVKKYGKDNGKQFIRLDYDGNRKPIADLYSRNGFIPIEIISNEHVSKLIKAEYRI